MDLLKWPTKKNKSDSPSCGISLGKNTHDLQKVQVLLALLFTHGSSQIWLLVDLALWKMMDFVNWDDYPIYEMENKTCSKPPTSYDFFWILPYSDKHVHSYIIVYCHMMKRCNSPPRIEGEHFISARWVFPHTERSALQKFSEILEARDGVTWS